jgi:hypothetical protein
MTLRPVPSLMPSGRVAMMENSISFGRRRVRCDNGQKERVHGQMGNQLMAREFLIVSFRRTSWLMSFSVPVALVHLSNSDRQPRPREPHAANGIPQRCLASIRTFNRVEYGSRLPQISNAVGRLRIALFRFNLERIPGMPHSVTYGSVAHIIVNAITGIADSPETPSPAKV